MNGMMKGILHYPSPFEIGSAQNAPTLLSDATVLGSAPLRARLRPAQLVLKVVSVRYQVCSLKRNDHSPLACNITKLENNWNISNKSHF
jgi:hypothetical protein